jgi:hypothetical protein
MSLWFTSILFNLSTTALELPCYSKFAVSFTDNPPSPSAGLKLTIGTVFLSVLPRRNSLASRCRSRRSPVYNEISCHADEICHHTANSNPQILGLPFNKQSPLTLNVIKQCLLVNVNQGAQAIWKSVKEESNDEVMPRKKLEMTIKYHSNQGQSQKLLNVGSRRWTISVDEDGRHRWRSRMTDRELRSENKVERIRSPDPALETQRNCPQDEIKVAEVIQNWLWSNSAIDGQIRLHPSETATM